MSLYRVIIQGRLDFGNKNSYDKVLKMYEYQLESYYKFDTIFKESSDIFYEDQFAIIITRYVGQSYEKTFKNTAKLLQYCSQFAVTGVIKAWQTDNGAIINYKDIEPNSDKQAVRSYQKGKKLAKVEGSEKEALDELSNAINKYNKHAQAYEWRAGVKLSLQNFEEAEIDFKKSLAIDDSNPFPYYGLAKIAIHHDDWQKAIEYLDLTCKKSLALQEIYWNARRLKGKGHFLLSQWQKAIFDLKLFVNRKFKSDQAINKWKRLAFYQLGYAYLESGDFEESIISLEKALSLPSEYDNIPLEDIYFALGSAKYKSGKNGFIKDFKKAGDLGNSEAIKMLENVG